MECKPYKINPETKEKLCFSVDELAAALGIGRAHAYELVRSQGFPSITVGRRILAPISGVARWLEEQAGGGKNGESL